MAATRRIVTFSPPSRTNRLAILAGGTAMVLLVAVTFAVRLNGDVQYVLGVLHVSDDGPVGTFAHRPIVYRVGMAALMAGPAALGISIADQVAYESAIRFTGLAIAAACGVALWRSLRGHLVGHVPVAIGVATGSALALAPNWDFLQAEWLAAALAALAVAVALSRPNRFAAVAAAGVLLAGVAGMKLVTVAFVPIAIVAIWALDRRAATWTVAVFIIASAALAGVVLGYPFERNGMLDVGVLNSSSEVSSFGSAAAVLAIISKAMLGPWTLLAPAAAVMIVRMQPTRQRRLIMASSLVMAGMLAVAPLLIQARWSVYHAAILPVLAGTLVAGVATQVWQRTRRPPWLLLAPLPILSLGATVVLTLPQGFREDLEVAVTLVCSAASVGLAGWAGLAAPPHEGAARPRRESAAAAVLAVASVLAFLPVTVPNAAWALSTGGAERTNENWTQHSQLSRDRLSRISETIGRDTKVLYLAYGDYAYHMGNPTTCRYPSPLWLQRGTLSTQVRTLWSYRDNRRCLDSAQEHIIVQPGWLYGGRYRADLDRFLAMYDCVAPFPAQTAAQMCERAR